MGAVLCFIKIYQYYLCTSQQLKKIVYDQITMQNIRMSSAVIKNFFSVNKQKMTGNVNKKL